MAERDERELVLGNKQLISLFFVAVALCGVFFALGYMIGRNASKGSIASLDTTGTAAPDSARPSAAAPASTEPSAPSATAADTAPAQPDAQTFTQPAREAPPSPQPVPPPAAPQPVAPPAAAAVSKPEAGATYVQVTALRRTDAENLVKTLRDQGLPASLADSSKPELFRVLVGPYRQTADVADAKAKLKGLGFANTFVQKQP